MAVIYGPDGAKLSYDAEEIDERLGPESNGTAGQVLKSNGDGTRFWGMASDALLENVTYYVSSSGSDTTGDGTQEHPFKTVSKALLNIPKNLNGHVAAVSIMDASFPISSQLKIENFYAGEIKLIASEISTSFTGECVLINNCDGVIIDVDKITLTYLSSDASQPRAVVVKKSYMSLARNLTIDNTAGTNHGYGIQSAQGSTVNLDGSTLTVNNFQSGVVAGSNGVLVSSWNSGRKITINNSTYGLFVQSSGMIAAYTVNNATTKRRFENGLIIENGTFYSS